MGLITCLLTKNRSNIPLLHVTFDYNKFKKDGSANSCILSVHPAIRNDECIKKSLNDVVDYIRDNYNMEDM